MKVPWQLYDVQWNSGTNFVSFKGNDKMRPVMSLEKQEYTGPLWHATEMNNRTEDDTVNGPKRPRLFSFFSSGGLHSKVRNCQSIQKTELGEAANSGSKERPLSWACNLLKKEQRNGLLQLLSATLSGFMKISKQLLAKQGHITSIWRKTRNNCKLPKKYRGFRAYEVSKPTRFEVFTTCGRTLDFFSDLLSLWSRNLHNKCQAPPPTIPLWIQPFSRRPSTRRQFGQKTTNLSNR